MNSLPPRLFDWRLPRIGCIDDVMSGRVRGLREVGDLRPGLLHLLGRERLAELEQLSLGALPAKLRHEAAADLEEAVGGAAAGLAGAMTAQYLTGWNPDSWLMLLTFTYFTGLILGGAGNSLGVALGIALIPIGFREATRFLPTIGYVGLIEALQWVAIGLLALLVLYLKPNGILPERPVRYSRQGRVSSNLLARFRGSSS